MGCHCGSLDIRPCGLRHGVSAGGTLCLRLFFVQMDVQVMTWLQKEATTPPPSVNLYPKGGNPGKMVEIPAAAGCKSLPKVRKSAEKVEIPKVADREFLPKSRKSREKGRDSWCRRPEISTQTAKNPTCPNIKNYTN